MSVKRLEYHLIEHRVHWDNNKVILFSKFKNMTIFILK